MTGRPVHYYWTTTTPPTPGRVTTSRIEIRDIVIAFLVLTFDLVLIIGGGTLLAGGSALGAVSSAFLVGVAATAALTGFLAHELAHKVAAQRRHSWAEFRMFPMGLVLSVFTAFVGFLFAAPGATMVGGMYDARAWGRTSLAGPATNLAFATAFFASAYGSATLGGGALLLYGLILLAFFNAWFAAFNLIPFGPLDGRKVYQWSAPIWGGAMALSAVAAVIGYLSLLSGHLLGM